MQTQFSYDVGDNAKGRLSKVTDNSGQSTWQYNRFGMLLQKEQLINSPPNASKQLLRQNMEYGNSDSANGKLVRIDLIAKYATVSH